MKATAREPINRPDTYQRLLTARPQLRSAAGPYIRGKPRHPTSGERV